MADGGGSSGIGASVRRREDLRLLTGQGRYSDDFRLPDQVYAVMVRSPHAHAEIGAIDSETARAIPGVLAVLTGQDMLADGLRPIPHAVWSGHPAEIALPNRNTNTSAVVPSGSVGDALRMLVDRHACVITRRQLLREQCRLLGHVERLDVVARGHHIVDRDRI